MRRRPLSFAPSRTRRGLPTTHVLPASNDQSCSVWRAALSMLSSSRSFAAMRARSSSPISPLTFVEMTTAVAQCDRARRRRDRRHPRSRGLRRSGARQDPRHPRAPAMRDVGPQAVLLDRAQRAEEQLEACGKKLQQAEARPDVSQTPRSVLLHRIVVRRRRSGKSGELSAWDALADVRQRRVHSNECDRRRRRSMSLSFVTVAPGACASRTPRALQHLYACGWISAATFFRSVVPTRTTSNTSCGRRIPRTPSDA